MKSHRILILNDEYMDAVVKSLEDILKRTYLEPPVLKPEDIPVPTQALDYSIDANDTQPWKRKYKHKMKYRKMK